MSHRTRAVVFLATACNAQNELFSGGSTTVDLTTIVCRRQTIV